MTRVLMTVDVFVMGDICFDETKLVERLDDCKKRITAEERPLPFESIEENLLRLESLRPQLECQSPAGGSMKEDKQYDSFPALKI